MSIDILKNTTNAKPHSIHDDIESILWVLYYIALRYFKIISGTPYAELEVFDEQRAVIRPDRQVRYIGGDHKWMVLHKKEIQKLEFESKHLTKALHHLADILEEYEFSQRLISRGFKPSEIVKMFGINAIQAVETVEDIIKPFDLIIDGEEWPEHDDSGAVEDRFPKQVTVESLGTTAQLPGRSSLQAASSQSTSSRRISPSKAFGKSVELSSNSAEQASARLPGVRLIPRAYCCAHLAVPSRTSVKRSRDEYDDEDQNEQIHNGREKRTRIETEVAPARDKGRSGVFGQFIRALVRKASKVLKRRKN